MESYVFNHCLPHYVISNEKEHCGKCSKQIDNLIKPGNPGKMANEFFLLALFLCKIGLTFRIRTFRVSGSSQVIECYLNPHSDANYFYTTLANKY